MYDDNDAPSMMLIDDKDIPTLAFSGMLEEVKGDKKEQLLLRPNVLKNVYENYKELSKKVNGVADEEKGKDLYMKNHDYNWIEVLFNGTEKQFIIEVEGEDND